MSFNRAVHHAAWSAPNVVGLVVTMVLLACLPIRGGIAPVAGGRTGVLW